MDIFTITLLNAISFSTCKQIVKDAQYRVHLIESHIYEFLWYYGFSEQIGCPTWPEKCKIYAYI